MNHTGSHSLFQTINSPVVSAVVVVALIALIVYRQTRPRKLNLRSLLVFPLIILVLIVEGLRSYHPTTTSALELVLDIVVTTVLGVLAARQLTVYLNRSTGTPEAAGSLRYFLWWLAAFAVKALLAITFQETPESGLSEVGVLSPVFFLLVTRSVYLYVKARRLGLRPR